MSTPTELKPAADIKARMVSLTVLEITSTNLEAVDNLLLEKVSQAQRFFRNAPVMVDLGQLDDEVDGQWLEQVYGILKSNNFIPVGITGVSEPVEYMARSRNIAVWPSPGSAAGQKPVVTAPQEPEEAVEEVIQEEPEEVPVQESSHNETLVVKQPVRSGQKVYASGGDLIVLAPVSTGAELLADGHIHVYGTLRGRAQAGVKGNEDARIFCHNLQADLISIAGYYMINDDLSDEVRKKAVHISLQGDRLNIEPLE